MSLKRKLRDDLRTAAQAVFGQEALDVPAVTEILQARILHALFSNMKRDLVLVKGGIAMQMLTGSNRSTSDIDLAAEPETPTSTLATHMRKSIQWALSTGLLEEAQVREQDLGGGGLSPKWHINGRLAGSESRVHLKIEISRRDLLPDEAISRFTYTPASSTGVPSYMVRTYSLMAVAASKTAAILDKKRYSPRDLYDLYILIEMKVDAPVAMLASMGKEENIRMLNYLWTKMTSFSYQDFLHKVSPHLPLDVTEKIDELKWMEMQIKVGESVEFWLQSAEKIAAERIPRDGLRDYFEEIKSRQHALEDSNTKTSSPKI